jgi:hypothetical protein
MKVYPVRYDFNTYDQGEHPVPPVIPEHGPLDGFANLVERNDEIRDRRKHKQLKKDLVEHIWQRYVDAQEVN